MFIDLKSKTIEELDAGIEKFEDALAEKIPGHRLPKQHIRIHLGFWKLELKRRLEA